jgi:hypothetical protein
LEVLEVQKN